MSRTNLALLAVVVVLGAFVLLVEKPWSGPQEGYVTRKPLFEDFDPARVAEVELARGGDALTLRQRDGGWAIASHGDYPANASQVGQIVAAVEQWKVEARVGTAQKAETYMVDESKGTRVTLRDAAGAVLADLFTGRVAGFDPKEAARQGGKVDTESFGIYVRRADGQDVYFMKGLFLGTFSPDTSSFIERKLVSFEPEKAKDFLARCTAADGGGEHRVHVVKEGGAFLLEGMEYPPDGAAVKLMVEAFSRLTATELAGKYEPGKYGLEPPACVVTCTLEDGTVESIEVGGPKEDKGYYARRPGAPFVVVISKWEVESYRREPKGFASKRLWSEAQPDLRTMRLESDRGVVELAKSGDDWAIVTKELGDVPADRTAAWRLVNAITNAEVKDYLAKAELPEHGLARPRLRATATTASGATLRLVVGGDRGEAEVVARNADSPWIVAVPRKVLEDLSVGAAELKERKPEQAAPQAP